MSNASWYLGIRNEKRAFDWPWEDKPAISPGVSAIGAGALGLGAGAGLDLGWQAKVRGDLMSEMAGAQGMRERGVALPQGDEFGKKFPHSKQYMAARDGLAAGDESFLNYHRTVRGDTAGASAQRIMSEEGVDAATRLKNLRKGGKSLARKGRAGLVAGGFAGLGALGLGGYGAFNALGD